LHRRVRRGGPHPLRPAGGGERAGGRLPHRVLVDELRPHADRRVRQHDHGVGAGRQPVPGGLELGPALPPVGGAPRLRVVLRQGRARAVRVHLAPGHPPALPLRPAHALRLEGPDPPRRAEHPGHRGPGGGLSLMDAILFYAFAVLALGAALVVIGQRNPTYSAFALILVFCSLSGIYGLLGSPFIATLQIVVYAGAIMVLFLFVLMLLNVKRELPSQVTSPRLKASALVLCVLLVFQ